MNDIKDDFHECIDANQIRVRNELQSLLRLYHVSVQIDKQNRNVSSDVNANLYLISFTFRCSRFWSRFSF